MSGDRQRADAIDGKHAHISPSVTVGDEIQSTVYIPETIGIDFPPAGGVARGRIVAHLHGARLCNRTSELLDRVSMLTVSFMRPETDREISLHLPDIRRSLRRQYCDGLVERRIERCLDFRPVQRFEKIAAEDER